MSKNMMAARLVLLVVVCRAPVATADDAAPTAGAPQPSAPDARPRPIVPIESPEPTEREHKHTAAEVASNPRPGDESGRADPIPGDSGSRKLGRVVLFVPWVVSEIAFAPIRGALWAEERYQLEDLYYRTFYNRDRTIGLVPTATYITGLGGTVGGRFLDLDVFGQHEYVELAAETGGRFRQDYVAKASTGDRLGPLELRLDADYIRLPAYQFYGIGNGNFVSQPVMPIDPITTDAAVTAYNRYREGSIAMTADVHALATDCAAPDGPPELSTKRLRRCGFHVIATGQLATVEISHSTKHPSIEEVFDRAVLVGFDHPIHHAYGALELRWDTRRRVTEWEPRDVRSVGTLASVFAGRVDQFGNLAGFWRYGVELQQYWRIAEGPRLIVARFHGEGVTAPLDQIIVDELPLLGGDTFLRGYPYGRFRDRVAAVASAQYQWDLAAFLDAYVFVDVGRVYSGPDDITLSHLRVGYGVGVELHGTSSFLVEGSVATSIDGGIVFTASFNPILDNRTWWR
jgi:hypothetical protein